MGSLRGARQEARLRHRLADAGRGAARDAAGDRVRGGRLDLPARRGGEGERAGGNDMTGVEVVLAIVKSLGFILILVSLAAVTTWADRRQGAMVQDRVGPN